MFRWLKDRKKSRKPSSNGSVRSKEDDYGFKQKHSEWKRDLPPTPFDSASSHSSFTDDDKSFHIYEEIPDLPFRCTPEGELRISLARESAAASTRESDESRSDPSVAVRNVSPYMVVPLERLSGTPLDFQNRQQQQQQQQDGSFACALVGRRRSPCDGPGCDGTGEDVSQGASTPSCDDSSVFSTPLGLEGRCAGLGGGDISDRLLSAINLTRLLAAVRLSSSSAETCTTSPICIGVDKDGRNISVSVSVTPTTTISANNDDDNDVTHAGDVTAEVEKSPLTGAAGESQNQSETGSGKPQTETGSSTPQTETGSSRPQPQRGLRFLPSPLEQNALSEILQLRPGESTELDHATIDAIIHRLCSESLPSDPASDTQATVPETCSQRNRQDLGASESALNDTWGSSGETTAAHGKGGQHQQSPKSHRAENSDTCYEYDISTSSESDQTNYDYFLSKVARTRSLECEVKEIIKKTESVHSSQDSDQEDEEGEGGGGGTYGDGGFFGAESFSTVSSGSRSNSCRHHHGQRRYSPEVDITVESDDGTMADLSESENSSGYYESAPVAGLSSRTGNDGERAVRFAGVGSDLGAFASDRSGLGIRRFSGVAGAADDSVVGKKSGSGASDPEMHFDKLSSFVSHTRKGSDPVVGAAPWGVTQAVPPSRPHHSRACKGKCSANKKSHHHHSSHHRQRGHKCGGKGRTGREGDISCNDDGTRKEEGLCRHKIDDDCIKDTCVNSGDSYETCYSRDSKDTCNKRDSKGACNRKSEVTCNCKDTVNADSERADTQKKNCAKCRQEKTSRRSHKDRTYTKPAPSTKPAKDNNSYPYSYLYDPHPATSTAAGGTTTTTTTANLSRSHKTSKSLKGREAKDRSSPLETERVSTESVYEGRRHAGEVYSIPAALPDSAPQGPTCATVRGLKSSSSVPSKLSVARHIPESSEVYGTRAGVGGCSNNRLLSDLIMLNYNRQVFNL